MVSWQSTVLRRFGRNLMPGLQPGAFAPGLTGLAAFESSTFVEGAAVLTIGEGLDSVAGAVTMARDAGAVVIPTTLTGAKSGPTVAAGVYPVLRERLLASLAPLRGQVDGVSLQLHGAMVTRKSPTPRATCWRRSRHSWEFRSRRRSTCTAISRRAWDPRHR